MSERHVVGSDTELSGFGREVPNKALDSTLACGVHRLIDVLAGAGRARRDLNNSPPACLAHTIDGNLDAVHSAEDVEVDGSTPLRGRQLPEWLDDTPFGDAGVVDDDVDRTAECGLRGANMTERGVIVRDIERGRDRSTTRPDDTRSHLPCPVAPQVVDYHRSTLLCKDFRDSFAHTLSCAGDQCDSSTQVEHACSSLWLPPSAAALGADPVHCRETDFVNTLVTILDPICYRHAMTENGLGTETAEKVDGAPATLTSFNGGVARLTLDNPRRKNAITLHMAAAIVRFCDRVEEDDTIGAVVVDARGSYFCSGADTRDLASSSSDPASPDAVARTSAIYGAFVRVGSLPVPTIAVVSGGAVGAGLNLAMAADIMVVTPDAQLESGFLARSIHPGGGHLSLLGRSLRWADTIALAACGQSLTGAEAAAKGLAYAAVEASEISQFVDALVRTAAADPQLTRRVKASARLELGPPAVSWSSAVEIERGVQMWSMSRKGNAAWSSRGPSAS